MMDKFDVTPHITKIKGKDFLKAGARVLWFRAENPQGRIVTEMLNLEPPVFRAEIFAFRYSVERSSERRC